MCDTDGMKSQTMGNSRIVEEEQQTATVFLAGTFNELPQELEDAKEENQAQHYPSEIEFHRDPTKDLNGISFGISPNVSMRESMPEPRDKVGGSIVSIRDIQEVRDKVPASPATA